MARTPPKSRDAKGLQSTEPVSDLDFEEEAEAMALLRDGLSMIPGTGAYRTRPQGLSSDGDDAGLYA
jgi:hypothetical protein